MPKHLSYHGRFWEKVVNGPNGCWNWTGKLHTAGYGRFIAGKNQVTGKRIEVLAHRYAWESLGNELPPFEYGGLQLDHLCRNTSCVNPKHLELVTPRTNVLRGVSVISRNSQKTHCSNGHEFTEKNTYKRTDKMGRTGRICRKCVRTATIAWNEKMKIAKEADKV